MRNQGMSPSGSRYALRLPLWLCFSLTMGLSLVIFAFLAEGSLPVFSHEGAGFILGQDWDVGAGVYGALPMLYGTLAVTLIALAMALPLGLGSAVMTSEFLPARLRLPIKALMELLAAVPGVVYGLIGMVTLSALVRDSLGLIDGNTIITAGLLLGVMVLPTITTLSEDALRGVPGTLREQALGLGLTRGETTTRVVLPSAIKGITGAVLLGMSRAMGETIAVMLVIGGRDRLPRPLYNVFTSGQAITGKLGREGAEAMGMGLHWSALLGLGLLLFITVMGLTLAGGLVAGRGGGKGRSMALKGNGGAGP